MAKANRAFTLVELIVVVIIMGVLTAAAIVQFNKSIQRAAEREAVLNLRAMVGAIQIYHSKNGTWPPGMANVTAINGTLGTSFADTGKLTFACDLTSGGNDYGCEAVSVYGWTVVDDGKGSNDTLHCSGSGPACPTCDASGCL
jgi:prepilin-type N-terminal cleavage/methylation domain-containing protein